MNAEFNWWLLIVGVVGGAGLLWLVLGDWSRREEEVGEAERARESAWIAEVMRDEGVAVDPATAQSVLRLHRTWLRETGAYDPSDDQVSAEEDLPAPTATDGALEPAPHARPPLPTTEAAAAELRIGPVVTRAPADPAAGGASAWRDAAPVDRDRPERPASPGDLD